MQDKMKRFLASIGIEDIEAYDIDFNLVARDRYNRNIVNMVISKPTPWSYSLLERFLEGIGGISYGYTMRFFYDEQIGAEDVLSLYRDFYMSKHFDTPKFVSSSNKGNAITLSYDDAEALESEKARLKDFLDLLSFINYSFFIDLKLNEKQSKATTIAEAKVDLSDIMPKEDELPSFDKAEAKEEKKELNEDEKIALLLKQNEKAAEEELRKAEEDLIQTALENKKRMEEERNKERVFRTGNYRPLDSIEEIYSAGMESVDFSGTIFASDSRLTKKGTQIVTLSVTDEKSAITIRIFEGKRFDAEKIANLKVGNYYRFRGAIDNDKFTGTRLVVGHFIDLLPTPPLRDDPEEEKRVELHVHSKMSVMDATGTMSQYFALAKNMGMKALAVTDHGVCQSFPDAQTSAKKTGLKAIYGIEMYMFDDKPTYVFNPTDVNLLRGTYCVFDFETTGLSARYDRITEFGGVIVKNGMIVDSLDLFVNPEMHIPDRIQQKTHITDEMVANADKIDVAIKKIEKFVGDAILVSHNAEFDVGFMNAARRRLGMGDVSNPVIDTLALSHYFRPTAARHTLGALSRDLGLSSYNEEEAHRADFDAAALADVWGVILHRLCKDNESMTHADLANLEQVPEMVSSMNRHIRSRHVTALAKNESGLKDIYRIVSASHTTYLADVPKTPRRIIDQYRGNLLIGSSCLNGEIFQAARYNDMDELIRLMGWYDYIEIQPLENYSCLIYDHDVENEAELIRLLKDIVYAARVAGKPVVATGDVHYVNPEDKITRDVYIFAKAIGGSRHPLNPNRRDKREYYPNPDQHFRSTREMLDSFRKWMSEDEAREVVIKNSNMIADMCEAGIEPIKEGTFQPNANLPNSEQMIRNLCMENLHKHYGPNPDQSLIDRLNKELEGIIGNGYSVTYYIAQQIIKKANSEGYIVGSRGSVGSSFAATMADITEVNPLPPHYLCPKCKHFEYSGDKSVRSGFDLPEKHCPECGTLMHSDGQNIPFETFLGFNAEKVPDIDLNFDQDYQAIAHDYTRVLLGAKNVFRAGTIETVAEKTAFGYIKGYFERIGKDPDSIPSCWIAYISSKCEGVKRTTGQHPGGIVVVPADMSIYDFTAYNHPANDPNANWLTTHFDYHAMHDELLKLDLLGHVDPLATRLMANITHINIKDIPMNDKKVLSLFNSPDALNLADNSYLKLSTGAAGLPEFGTNMAQRMLNTAKPKCFNDLLIISGLAHGTNVWANNAEDLITSGTTDLQGVIGCRDDIMSYLISVGIPSSTSFKIMEDVRKGRKLKPAYEEEMREKGVPDYYIESCKKIAYLFPRAHATAYVTMAVRVAYFKLYYPLAFYAVYFSVRCDAWDLKAMIEGKYAIIEKLEEYNRRVANRDKDLKPKDKSIADSLHLALEMIERGYKFENISLEKSDATRFVVDEENKALIPPFIVVDGLGANAAKTVVEARKDGRKFLSKEDLLRRTKLNGTNVEDLAKLGVLDGLGETNQMSLFEFMSF